MSKCLLSTMNRNQNDRKVLMYLYIQTPIYRVFEKYFPINITGFQGNEFEIARCLRPNDVVRTYNAFL